MGLAERLGPPAADLLERLRTRGFRHAGGELLRRLKGKVYVAYDEIVIVKTLAEPAPVGADPGWRIEDADASRLPLLDAFSRRHGNRRGTRRFERELEAGSRLMLAFAGSELVGYAWWTPGPRAATRPIIRRLGIHPREDDAYGFDIFVAPEVRGRALATRLSAAQEAELFRLGYRRKWTVIDRDNEPARRLFAEGPDRASARVRSRVILSRWVVKEGGLDRLYALEPARSSSAAPTDSSSAGTC